MTPPIVVDVVLFDVFRDGGTRCYQDREGVGYWKYFEDGRIYDEYPYPNGRSGGLAARELNISLNIVDSF